MSRTHNNADHQCLNKQQLHKLWKKMQAIFGILMMFIGAASGLLFQDPVICKFNKSDQCYVALGERLHLLIPPADGFNLNMRDKTSGNRTIIRFRKNNPVYSENHTRWQFVKENNTMILTSAERSDSGTYSLDTVDAGGALTGSYTLQLHTEAQVSSVSVWYKCLASEDIKVHCSAEGDDLNYSWTSDFNTLSQLESGTSTHTLNKGQHGNITCYVKNHVSQSHNTTVLQPYPALVLTPEHIAENYAGYHTLNVVETDTKLSIGFKKVNILTHDEFMTFVLVWCFEILILLSLLVGANLYTRISKRRRIIKTQVSSVSVWYKCLASEDIKVHCSAEGDDLTYSWTSDFNTLSQLENGTSTLTLNKGQHGNVTCYVKNHVSQSHNTTVLQPYPGLLFQDPVVCKFNKSDQCYVALGERLHLQIPSADGFNLLMGDKTSGYRIIIRFRKNNPLYSENHTRWQFVEENNTIILTSAERSDSGTYSLDTHDAGGALTGSYTLQLHTEAQVSSVSVWYKCLASEDIKVHCSAEGDNLTYSWTSDFNTLSQLESGTSTLTLNKGHHGNVTCYVKNHVSQRHNTTVLQPCPVTLSTQCNNGAASGLLFQEPVVCKFNKSDQCYVALGEPLHLQIPPAYAFNLHIRDKTSTIRTIIRFRKNIPNTSKSDLPRWQFVEENNTMILTSAERSDSGTYSLDTSDAGGTLTGSYTLQLHTEAQVSSVSVWYKCLASEDIKVHCSAEGDDLTYSWTSDFNTLSLLENGTSTLTLNKGHHGNVTCYVKNHVSQHHNTTVLQPCPGFRVFVSVWLFEIIILLSLLVGAFYIYTRIYLKQRIIKTVTSCTQSNNDFMVFVTMWLYEMIILLSLLVGAFYIYTRIYRKQRTTAFQTLILQYTYHKNGCSPQPISSNNMNL
ncbi:hypothetical protein C0J45_3274 [Silurus meridionalis]|nr:hypothetical protein C0J45_3274 [Silurus meridionalis]